MKTSLLRGMAAAGMGAMAALAAAAGPELTAALSVMGYGYQVKITINGTDIGVAGGKSEGRRLFNKYHEMAAKAAPAVRARNFVLVPGRNEIVIEYAKNDPKGNDALEVTLEAADYPQPLLRLVNRTKTADKLAVTVDIAEKPPAGFKPVVVENK